VEFVASERNALLILDSSGSMAADDGTGQTKMEAAKEALLRYSGPSSVLFDTGFAVFGHTGDATRAGRTASCEEAAEVLLPLGEMDPQSFEGALAEFEPTGWTPIEGALNEAESAFAGKEGQYNRVILVSDGLETCGGDPVAAAERLYRSGIEVQIDVVGFGVPDDETEQLRDIAIAGGGEYFDAETGADLDEYFRQQSEAMHQTWDAFTCELRNSTNDTICDQNQCNDATVFRIPEEQEKYDYGSPEYEALQDLSRRISDGLEERQEARNEAAERAQELQQQHSQLQEEYYRAFQQAYGV
jgi:Ca-activated chloride channel family protein